MQWIRLGRRCWLWARFWSGRFGTVMTVAFIQLRFFRDSYVTAFMSPSIVVTSYFP